jgi:hypothetical protein
MGWCNIPREGFMWLKREESALKSSSYLIGEMESKGKRDVLLQAPAATATL